MILYMNTGARWWTLSFTNSYVLWTQQSAPSWINIGITNGYTYPLWLSIDTVIAHHSSALWFLVIQALQILNRYQWRCNLYCERFLLKIHRYNSCKGCIIYFCWDAKSPAPITVVLKILHLLPRLLSSLLTMHMHYDYVHKCVRDHCLLTIRTYSFSGQFTEDQIAIILVFEFHSRYLFWFIHWLHRCLMFNNLVHKQSCNLMGWIRVGLMASLRATAHKCI